MLLRLFRAAFVWLGPSGLAQVLQYQTGQLSSRSKLLVMEQIDYHNVDINPDATYAVLGEQHRVVSCSAHAADLIAVFQASFKNMDLGSHIEHGNSCAL